MKHYAFKRFIKGDPLQVKEIYFYPNGTKYWYLNVLRHNENGPACEYSDGTKYWYLNGSFHREDGPAVEYANGAKEWWLNGILYAKENYWKAIEEYRLNKSKLAF